MHVIIHLYSKLAFNKKLNTILCSSYMYTTRVEDTVPSQVDFLFANLDLDIYIYIFRI